MKKLGITALGKGLVACTALTALLMVGATPALGHQSAKPANAATAPPIQGDGPHNIIIYVDTVTGGGTPKPAATCLQQSQFVRGQTVVFRMYAFDVPAEGRPLTPSNTQRAFLTVPGIGMVQFAYNGASAAKNHTPAYWEAVWKTAPDYTVGTVNFSVTIVAKPLAQWGIADFANSTVPAQTGVFRQSFNSNSALTIVAA